MAIDPRLYEKYSGRSGDPYKRLGEALAKSSARKSEVKGQVGRSFSDRYVTGAIKWRLWMGIVGGLIALVALASTYF